MKDAILISTKSPLNGRKSVVLFGPSHTGKSRNAAKIMKRFDLKYLHDAIEIRSTSIETRGSLYITNEKLDARTKATLLQVGVQVLSVYQMRDFMAEHWDTGHSVEGVEKLLLRAKKHYTEVKCSQMLAMIDAMSTLLQQSKPAPNSAALKQITYLLETKI